ncbi:YciI family protein [Naasia aerilata]|uniref:YCII-related domain-containing protein n=1 Tax=Naasia aerilata TaxID=1162966 RepID=A0ABM8GFJ8_9MICO|nr:hypothetical protein [Naasia aerilata]BDZ47116.1 hypothetical protein GCM10025866_30250 [Naasia aerilata]
MYSVCFYTVANAALVPDVYPRHRAWVDEFARGGGIVAIGNFGRLEEGAMSVFRSREAAQEFVARDPFVVEGVAVASPLRDWTPLEYDSSGARTDG